MRAIKFKRLLPDDYPGAPQWLPQLFLVLNSVLTDIAIGLSGQLVRGENLRSGMATGLAFRTATPASSTPALLVANRLDSAPTMVWVTRLARRDGAAITAAWSMTWQMNDRGLLSVTFQGLSDDTEYLVSLAYE
jgi:hypothetical protein